MAEKKHLVFFCEHLNFGGAEQAQIDFLKAIDADRYRISLIVELPPTPESHLFPQIPEYVLVRILYPKDQSGPNIYNNGFWRLIRRSQKIDKVLRIKEALITLPKADILIGFTLATAKYLPFFRKRYKMLYWVHGPKSKWSKSDLKKFYGRILMFDYVITVSHVLEKHIKEFFPRAAARVRTVYTPMNLSEIERRSRDLSELSPAEAILLNEKYYVAVARFVPEKDLECLIRAWKLLQEKNFDAKLVIVGDGTGRSALEKLISELALSQKVILVGMKQNPFVWMRNSRAFVHSAKTEGFGLVLVEAMALGKVVISSNCPVGPAEILENGKSGILVPAGNFSDFANQILKVELDAEFKLDMEKKACVRAQDFSSEKVLPHFYRIIDSL